MGYGLLIENYGLREDLATVIDVREDLATLREDLHSGRHRPTGSAGSSEVSHRSQVLGGER